MLAFALFLAVTNPAAAAAAWRCFTIAMTGRAGKVNCSEIDRRVRSA